MCIDPWPLVIYSRGHDCQDERQTMATQIVLSFDNRRSGTGCGRRRRDQNKCPKVGSDSTIRSRYAGTTNTNVDTLRGRYGVQYQEQAILPAPLSIYEVRLSVEVHCQFLVPRPNNLGTTIRPSQISSSAAAGGWLRSRRRAMQGPLLLGARHGCCLCVC